MNRRKFNLMTLLSPVAVALGVKAAPIPKVIEGGYTGTVDIVFSDGDIITAVLHKDEWVKLDEAVMKAARPLLRKWGDDAKLKYTVCGGSVHVDKA